MVKYSMEVVHVLEVMVRTYDKHRISMNPLIIWTSKYETEESIISFEGN
jgi:hypothetical protein